MANTQVFPLGLSVTVVNPLGLAIEHLHRDVERLRRQADGTRLGRLIGEVIRLGLELGKVRQAERQLALDQEQQHEDQIARLGDEVEAVERLRQHYLMLDRIIAGLARLKPFRASLLTSTFRSSFSVTREAMSTSTGQLSEAAVPAKVASPEFKVVLARGALVAAGLGMTALASRRGARAVMRRHPRNTQQRVARVAGQEWQEHRVDAIGKVGKAFVEGESGEEKAQGVGAAVGEVGGRVLGAVLARLTTSRLARKHGGEAGAYLGEAFGKRVAGTLYAWATEDVNAQPETDATPAGTAAQAADASPETLQQEPSQMAVVRAAVVAAGLGLTALAGRRGARAVLQRQPRNTRRRIARVAGQEWQEHRVDAIGKVGKALVEGESGEEKALGVGAAVGEVGGRVLGAVLARLTTSRLARKHGADAGAYLGDAFGKLVGGKLYDWVTQDAKAEPSASVTPGPAGERAASGLLEPKAQAQPQSQEAPAVLKQGDEAATPESIGQGAETGAPGAWSSLPLLKKGTGFGLPGIGTLFKKVPGAALLDASLQMVETYNSDDAPAQKLEGYGSAAGGLGGTLAGAAAGAALGSVVPVIGTAIGGLIGGVLGGMGGESAGGWLGRTVASITGNDEPGSSSRPATPLNVPQARADLPSLLPSAPEQSWQSAPPSTINQQFTFTANMPVTFNNSFDDPTTLQQLETIARRVLDDLMRQARSVQMADQPQP
ncbi:hypothetical protein ACIPZ5_14585 [Pseudomonas sp. NPDC089428]|uniref:hypothetical protein n=1 Tax=Pseudomonas sp. NPDC089428 TaxID=3364467 RepID=UPI003811B9B7